MTDTVLIAHRGLDDTYPENTLPAFEAALKLGMGIEFDISMTSDGHIVVIHDDTVDRTTDGSGKVADISLGELREFDAGSWKGDEFAGVKVPTFDEVLQLVAGQAAADPAIALDIRTLPPGIINMVCEALEKHGLIERTVGIGIITQSVDVRRRFYEGSAKFQCAGLAQSSDTLPLALTDPYSSWVYGRFVPSETDVESVHSANKKLLVSGDEVSAEVARAYTAVQTGPDAVLTWHPTELYGLVSG